MTLINGDDQIVRATIQVTVTGFTVDDGAPQQSVVRSLTYVFNSPTQAGPGAFELRRNGRPSNIDLHLTPLSDGMTYIISFSGAGVIGGSLPDGKYTLITLHDKVNVLSGPPMTSNDVSTFVRLFGDVEGLGVVNAADKALLKQAEGPELALRRRTSSTTVNLGSTRPTSRSSTSGIRVSWIRQ